MLSCRRGSVLRPRAPCACQPGFRGSPPARIFIKACCQDVLGSVALPGCPGWFVVLVAKWYTPELAKVKFHWKMPLKIHWTFPVKIRLESDNLLETTTDKWRSIETYHWTSIGKCHWKSTMISEVSISGVQSLPLHTPSLEQKHVQGMMRWSDDKWSCGRCWFAHDLCVGCLVLPFP